MRLLVAVMILVGATLAQAAPWLGLVKTGTTAQTNDTISLGTSSYNFDVRFDSGGNPVSTLQYWFYTTPANAVTFGATPVTALNNPLTTTDLNNGYAPSAGATLNSTSGWTIWSVSTNNVAFINNIATYEIKTLTLPAGEYVFSFGHAPGTDDEYLGWSGGNLYVNDFAAPGSFVLGIVPEPGTGTLLVYGSMVAAWRNRRRNTR
jgi:hypothetical protein